MENNIVPTSGVDKIGTIDEYLSDHKEGKSIDYNNPKCINCNDCCTLSAAITEKEYHKISKYLYKDVNGKILLKRAITLISDHLKKDILYMKCPLSTDSRKCGIYRIRPQVCKDFHCKESMNKVNRENLLRDVYKFTLYDIFFK